MSDTIGEILECFAREIHARRDELIPLVIDGVRHELQHEQDLVDERIWYLRGVIERRDESELAQVFGTPWEKPHWDRLSDLEIVICQYGLGYWRERVDPARKPEDTVPPVSYEVEYRDGQSRKRRSYWRASLGPVAVFPADLCPSSLDQKWPFDLSAVPTTRGAAALFLTELHDSVYRIGGNGIFEAAMKTLTPSTPDNPGDPAWVRLAAKHACFASGDISPEQLFAGTFDREPPRACDVEAALKAMIEMVFGNAAEPQARGKAKKGKRAGFSDEEIAKMLRDAIQAGQLKKNATHNAIAAWLRQSAVQSGLKTERRVRILTLVPEWTAGRKGNA